VDFLGQRLTWARAIWGLLIGGVGLWLAFRGTEVGDLVQAIRRVDVPLTLLALGSTGLTLAVSTWRWRLLFHPRRRDLAFAPLFRALVVGQMINIVSPLRVGELARAYVLSEGTGLSKAHVLATLAVEKVLDLVLFGLAIALLIGLMALPEGVRVRSSAQLGIRGAALVALWFSARFGLPLARAIERRLPPLPPRLRGAARLTVHRFVEGLTALRQPRLGATLFALSIVVLACSTSTNYLLFLAFGFAVPAWAAIFLLVLLQVGSVPPSLPGKIGVFNYLVVVGLGAFGIGRADALSYSIVLYAVALLPKVVLGAACLVASPLRWRTVNPTG
jgi:glycosyltransferase 2 family protein